MPKKNVDLSLLIEEFKLALEDDIELSIAAFARKKGVAPARLQKWLNNHHVTVTDMRTAAMVRRGLLDEPQQKLSDRYAELVEEYKKALAVRRTLSLSAFCREQGVPAPKLQKWLNRQGLSSADLKEEVLGAPLPKDVGNLNLLQLGNGAVARFRKTLREYKAAISNDRKITLEDFCKKRNTDYRLFVQWLGTLGMTERSIRYSLKLEQALPGGIEGSVFVQFKPNGGSNGDALKGVKIFFPDGSRVQVERCTVISLCSFLQTYDNQQRRKTIAKKATNDV